jgi:hypothetical protein
VLVISTTFTVLVRGRQIKRPNEVTKCERDDDTTDDDSTVYEFEGNLMC